MPIREGKASQCVLPLFFCLSSSSYHLNGVYARGVNRLRLYLKSKNKKIKKERKLYIFLFFLLSFSSVLTSI